MNKQNSNSKFKSRIVKFLLTLLIILTAVQFTNPLTVYADIDYGGGGAGHYVGNLFWGGSTDRTGFLFYILIDGEIMTADSVVRGIIKEPSIINICAHVPTEADDHKR